MDEKIKKLEKQIQALEQKKQKLQQVRIQKLGSIALQAGLGHIHDTTIHNAFAFIKRQIEERSDLSKIWTSDGQPT